MLKSVMSSTRVDIITKSKLFDISETLELRCVYDRQADRIKLDISMDWIVEYLQKRERKKLYVSLFY
jgi:hypothetical protein